MYPETATRVPVSGIGCITPLPKLGEQMTQPTEPLFAINEVTLKTLYETVASLDGLLSKVRGSAPPEKPEAGISAERHMLSDAYVLRALATQASNRVSQLHELLGINQ